MPVSWRVFAGVCRGTWPCNLPQMWTRDPTWPTGNHADVGVQREGIDNTSGVV